MSATTFRYVHFVGSIPLPDAETVFRAVSQAVGPHLKRLPDGEIGPRLGWIRCQLPLFADHPQMMRSRVETDWRRPGASEWVKFRMRPAVTSDSLSFGSLGYADWAKESYRVFQRLQEDGVIPMECRFQVSLPTPYGVTNLLVEKEDHDAVEPAYERAIKAEIAAIVADIPPSRLAIQWDVAQEIECIASGAPVFYPISRSGLAERLVRLGSYVPADAEHGIHLCYGDYEHKHFVEPTDMRDMVEILNRIWKAGGRPVDFVHMPVPRDRTDDAYFQPLKDLAADPRTEIYLGLIHFTDGIEGSRRRMETAERYLENFGIGTECGLGRRPAETIPELLRFHGQLAAGA